MAGTWLLYGANGYTGELIAKEAVVRGERPILAGRSNAVMALAADLGLECRVFDLADAAAKLDGVSAVLHCAGPFSATATPMVDACIARGVHYLDITGEIAVFEAIARRDEEARARGVMLMPGSGYDVAPTDCLAAYLAGKLPSATRLTLGVRSLGTMSHGTSMTMIEGFGKGGCVREGGVLTAVPMAHKTRELDFGDGKHKAITIAWGDVSTAFYSTGIPNIEVYFSVPASMRIGAKVARVMGPLLARPGMQRFLKSRVPSGGPDASARARGSSLIFGEVIDEKSVRVARAILKTPEPYALTVESALALVIRVARGEVKPGFQTVSRVFGADFVLTLPGTSRRDVT